jgi:Rho-binding antiterminator
MDVYVPVSCDFHDQLAALATLRQKCQIVYRTEADDVIEVEGWIIDVYAANRADYLKLKDGAQIRLDRIISVNGETVSSCID